MAASFISGVTSDFISAGSGITRFYDAIKVIVLETFAHNVVVIYCYRVPVGVFVITCDASFEKAFLDVERDTQEELKRNGFPLMR